MCQLSLPPVKGDYIGLGDGTGKGRGANGGKGEKGRITPVAPAAAQGPAHVSDVSTCQ